MENNNQDNNQQSSTQIRRYLVLALERWYLFLIAIIIAVVLFIYKGKFTYTKYGVSTTVLVDKQGSNPELLAGGLYLGGGRNLNNEMGLLRSYDLISSVIEELEFGVSYFLDNRIGYDPELYKTCPFLIVQDTLFTQHNNIKIDVDITDENSFKLSIPALDFVNNYNFGEKIQYKNFSFSVKKDSSIFNASKIGKSYYFKFNSDSYLTNFYKNSIIIEPEGEGSTILWIWTQGTVPAKDVDFLNKLVEIYINLRLDEKNQIAEKTIEFIDFQLKGFTDSLRQSEDELQFFKQQNSINLSDDGQMLMEQLQEFDTKRKRQSLKLDYYNYMLSVIKNNPDQMSVMSPSILGFSDPILEQHLVNLSEAIYNKKILQFSVKPDADLPPNVINDLAIEDLQLTIEQHITQTIQYTDGALVDLEKSVRDLQSEINKLPLAERQLLQITRQFDLNNEIYTFLLQRRMEAGITLASNSPDVRVIDKARIETVQYNGREGGANLPKLLIIFISIVVAIIFVIEFLKNKVEDKSDLERLTDLPIFSSISLNNRDSQLPTLKYPKSSISETFRLLRTNLQYSLIDKSAKMIVVTSTISGEGKSFVSSNLAAILSVSNKRTVLVGLDLRKPRVHHIFSLVGSKGVSDYIIGEINYNELVVKTKYDNLYVALPGTIPPNPAELIESEKMTDLFERLKEEFDYVIIDSPPVGIVADGLLIGQKADAYYDDDNEKEEKKNFMKRINEIVISKVLKFFNK